MKKHPVVFLVISFFILLTVACSKESEEITLTLERAQINFDTPDKQAMDVFFESNALQITLAIPESDRTWCSATLAENRITVKVSENISVGAARSTIITVMAEGLSAPQTISVTQAASSRYIRSFTIPAGINNLHTDIKGVIDDKARTITLTSSEWIGNVKNLIAQFETPGKLFIGEKEQMSGVTPNSFLEKLIYRVKTGDGQVTEYVLITRGPMFTGLPVIKVDIDGGAEVVIKDEKLPSTLFLTVPENNSFDKHATRMTIRGRGNSTWNMPKKPYRIDFPEETSLFGLAKAKKWVLLANYQDPTLLMNDVAFQLGRLLGLEFNHSSIHVELFINGTHRGNYQLTEQNEVGVGRVDIDTNGGFLVEMDTYFDEDYKFVTDHLRLPVMVAEPALNNENEMEYIRVAMQAMEDALFETDFPNNAYEEHTDVHSLINYMLINEVVRNQELGHPKSTYCYKEADTKIKWGPLWDFDWAFGYNEQNAYFIKTNLLFYQGNSDARPGARFFSRLMEIPGFRASYKARWREVRPLVAGITDYIDEKAARLDQSQALNFNIPEATPVTRNKSYQQLINQMKAWLEGRITFLDAEIDKM